jgi:periplasmic protein TonB
MRESQSPPSPVFLWALAASIAFHALALLALDLALRHTLREAKVDFIAARLELRAPRGAADIPIPPRVLKNTLDSGQPRPGSPVAPPPPESTGRDGLRAAPPGRAEPLSGEQLDVALGRLSETLLYPPEAVRQGLEGEVVVLLELGEDGRIMQAAVASGSGYALLDEAALRAVQQLGGLGPSLANKAILLPVRFRIR